MSTKTSIKRIALVAATALTLGGFSVITSESAHAAAADATGLAVSNAAPTSATSTTPGTAASPITASVAAGTAFYVAVATTGDADTITAYTTSDFSTTRITAIETKTAAAAITSGLKNQITAPGTPGTYYYKIATGNNSNTAAYLALTVYAIAAITYDGSSSGNNGTLTPSAVAGPANTVSIVAGQFQGKRNSITVSGAGATIAQVGNNVQTAGTVSTVLAAASDSSTTTTLVINTPNTGAITINSYAETGASTGIYSTTPSNTVTVTVNATGSSGVLSAANSTFYDTTTTGSTAISGGNLTTAPSVAATANAAAVVRYDWALNDALTNAMPSTTSYTVTISGPGVLGTTATAGQGLYRALSGTAASGTFYLFGDGTSGVATVTLSSGSTTIGSYSASFYSSTVASISSTVISKLVNAATATDFTNIKGSAGTTVNYISVTAKDSSGNAIPNATLIAKSSNTSVLTVSNPVYDSTDLVYYVPVTGVARGTADVTITNSAGTISSTAVTLQVVKNVISKFTLATDKASYNPGDKVLVTITATDANGDPVADGSYAKFIADTMSSTIPFASGSLFDSGANKPKFIGGVATRTLYAPLFNGDVTLTAYLGTSTTVLTTALQTSAANADAYTVKFSVNAGTSTGGDAALALDAANAATDAANNAYDEAQNATQAAQDALAAVTALAAQVKSLIASVKSLTALVSKIKAKVGA